MNINLFMAIFWMVLGAGLVGYHWMYPGETFLRLRGTDLSPGWLIMILAAWNVIRWWSALAAEKDRKMQENLTYERQRRHGSLPVTREEAPNPEFDFSRKESDPTKPNSSNGSRTGEPGA
jgi:hypothetical protein